MFNETRNGFTLIEVLVVIFILGSFLLIAVPKLQDITDVNLKSTARSLSGTIRHLYNESVFKKKIYKLTFDLDNHEYWVEYLEGSEFQVSYDPLLKKKKLPDGILFRDVLTERSQGKVDSGSDLFILFLPTGFVEYAVIHLRAENDSEYTLVTKPYTGGTKIYDEYLDFFPESTTN